MFKKQHIINKTKGAILIEMLIAVFIFLLISGVVFTLLATGRNAWYIEEIRIQLQQELRKSMEATIEELRQSSSNTIVGVPPDSNWYNTITFKKPNSIVNGSIVWSQQITYSLGGLNNRQLLRTMAGSVTVLANDIISLQIRRQSSSPNIIEVTVGADKTTYRGTQLTASLNFKVKLRN